MSFSRAGGFVETDRDAPLARPADGFVCHRNAEDENDPESPLPENRSRGAEDTIHQHTLAEDGNVDPITPTLTAAELAFVAGPDTTSDIAEASWGPIKALYR